MAIVRSHRQGEDYPTAEVLLGNLPIVLRALCDHVMTGEATTRQVETLGGKLLRAPEDIPDIGRFCVLQDPQGEE